MKIELDPTQEKRLRELAEERGKTAETLALELLDEAIAKGNVPENGKPIPAGAVSPERRLSNLRGLGKEIWQGEDAQGYVNRLREEEWR